MTTARRSHAGMSVALATVFCAAPLHASDLAFLETSSELDDGRPITQRYNAIDDKPATSWCTKPGESANRGYLSFGFAAPTTITHVGLIVGATVGETLDRSKKRARVVSIGDGRHRVEATFRDVPSLQLVELKPPAKGRRIVIEFAGVYDGTSADAPLCVSEVVLRSKSTPLTGDRVMTKYRALNASEKRLLREWLDDVSAPQRRLIFEVDRTFRYTFDPLLEGSKASVRGNWLATERFITLDVGGKQFRLSARRTKIDEGERQTVELVLGGDAPHPSMAAAFRPAPSRLP